MNIGIITYGFNQWGGGIDFIKHMLAFLKEAKKRDKSISITVFLPKKSLIKSFIIFAYPLRSIIIQIIKRKKLIWERRPGFSEEYIKKTFSEFDSELNLFFCYDSFTSQLKAAKNCNLDLVFPCINIPPKNFDLPWIGYIPDFQHCHLPKNFTNKEIRRRDLSFLRMLNTAKNIIVYSNSVIRDADLFFPGYTAKIHALPFCPCPQKYWLESTLDVRSKYGIESSYFLISNQFWVHKDHTTAFRAFAKYCQEGGKAILVCTGEVLDPRFPEYFKELSKLIDNLEISSRIKILGHIPKIEQISLLKKSLAVIQATLFEGGPGGGSSYDAISLGIPVIASDIPINLEMNCGDVQYFKAGDHEGLTNALFLMEKSIRVNESIEDLWVKGLRRNLVISDALMDVIHQAVNSK
jgi:glycosyltransferase involved in cell wall biosynthesis